MKFINYRVSAGRAFAKLGSELFGLTVIAPTGYMQSCVHERIGIAMPLPAANQAPEGVFQFQWADEEGTAEICIIKSDEITLCLSPDQLQIHLIGRLEKEA